MRTGLKESDMDDRSKETYEETLDALAIKLYAEQCRAHKDVDRWLSGSHPDDAKFPPMSEARTTERNKRMAAHSRAEAQAFEHARKEIERLLKHGDPTPLTQAQLTEFERLVFDAFKNSGHARAAMYQAFHAMSVTQRRQAWTFVSGRAPPPSEGFEHSSFLAATLGDLLPEV